MRRERWEGEEREWVPTETNQKNKARSAKGRTKETTRIERVFCEALDALGKKGMRERLTKGLPDLRSPDDSIEGNVCDSEGTVVEDVGGVGGEGVV